MTHRIRASHVTTLEKEVERLRERERELCAHSKRTMDVLAEVMMAVDDGDLERIPFGRVRTIYNETPEKALREVRAEAGREGWLDGYVTGKAEKGPIKAGRGAAMAAQYAQQRRSGKDE